MPEGPDGGEPRPPGQGRRRGRGREVLPWVIERTLLAWIRTGLAVMAFGTFLVRYGLRRPEWNRGDRQLGTALVLAGGVVCALGAIRYLAVRRALDRSETPVADPRLPVALAFAVAIAALLLVALLFPSLG
jgi:putative membrane protein